VQTVAQTLHDIISPRDGVELLVTCIEQEPKWFPQNNQDGWAQFSHHLALWRWESTQRPPRIDDALAERLLALVLKELRRDLESHSQRNRTMYAQNNSYFWTEKKEDFRRTAEAVYNERKDSGAAVQYVAEYLYHHLDAQNRGIEMLLVAHGEKLLEENGQSTLARYLHYKDRFGESIAILQPLVELQPDNLEYRTRLMHAYFRTGRRAEMLALLKATDEHFHQKGRWGEGPLAALAESCLNNELFEQAIAYYEELVPLHQRTQPNRGIGSGTLSTYYGNLSRAYAGLKNTAKAVEAASGAIVSWGPREDERKSALAALEHVLSKAPDLDAYTAELDKQVEESGLENPIVRRALGTVYREKNQHAKAIKQLELALAAQPNDKKTYELLVACYDAQGDKPAAVRQLLAAVELSRRDIDLFKELGERYDDLENATLAERARTSVVEMLPTESEGHEMLAKIREAQNRWQDAIDHWRRVSEIRKLEPTGFLGMAEAQLHEKQLDAAEQTIRQLEARHWPERFGDVPSQISNLRRQLEQARR
jgi:tetratricopeptide (TPR) repeat protein